MPDSTQLLDVARRLAGGSGAVQATDAELRRAVSAAYYAVFHKLAGAAASHFAGPDAADKPAYAILYRSFDHRHMKLVCEALKSGTLKEKFRRALRRIAVSQDMRRFAEIFPDLQNTRHLADYDPATLFLASDVTSHILKAELAIAAFDRVPPDEQSDILALMMVRARE